MLALTFSRSDFPPSEINVTGRLLHPKQTKTVFALISRVVKTEATVTKVHEVLRFYHVFSCASRLKNTIERLFKFPTPGDKI